MMVKYQSYMEIEHLLFYESPRVVVVDLHVSGIICQSVPPNGLEGTGIDPLDI